MRILRSDLAGEVPLASLPLPAPARDVPLLIGRAAYVTVGGEGVLVVDIGVPTDPYIVYTSNIFAILGLRALYFALAAMIDRFAYLKYALALVLVFIGGKILAVDLVGKIPAVVSLTVTVGLIAGGVLFSLWKTRPGVPRIPAGQS